MVSKNEFDFAIGARSVMADQDLQQCKNLNLKIKFRNLDLLPAIKFDKLNEWFNLNVNIYAFSFKSIE